MPGPDWFVVEGSMKGERPAFPEDNVIGSRTEYPFCLFYETRGVYFAVVVVENPADRVMFQKFCCTACANSPRILSRVDNTVQVDNTVL